jgi:acetolactate synthase-1/2/3 large subunit
MYTLQALWTQARERLDVVTLLFANRAYAILQGELQRVGADSNSRKAQEMLDLSNPTLDWVQLAQGMGVEASRATTAEALADQLAVAFKAHGPHLIEVVL